MGGLFGGGKKSSKDSAPAAKPSTTADSIETADGTVYRRSTPAPAQAATPKTAEPMGKAMQEPMKSGDPFDAITKKPGSKGSPTIGGASYGFG